MEYLYKLRGFVSARAPGISPAYLNTREFQIVIFVAETVGCIVVMISCYRMMFLLILIGCCILQNLIALVFD